MANFLPFRFRRYVLRPKCFSSPKTVIPQFRLFAQAATQSKDAPTQRIVSRTEFIANKKIAYYTKHNDVEHVEFTLKDMEDSDLELTKV